MITLYVNARELTELVVFGAVVVVALAVAAVGEMPGRLARQVRRGAA